MSATIIQGDARHLPLDDASVDAIVTDPPYGLEFMGKEWDRFSGAVTDRGFKGFVLSQQRTRNVKCTDCGRWAYDHPGHLCECGGIRRAQGSAFQLWCAQWAAEALRVLKPGGHLLAFGGSRTWHRLACAIEDAGFDIRDSIGHAHTVPVMAWVHGQGFPKGSSQLKPAWEPIVVARKPLAGTVAQNVQTYGTGALNIDATRVAHTDDLSRYERSATSGYKTGGIYGDGEPRLLPSNHAVGRWPTNVVLSHVGLTDDNGEIIGDACADGCVDGCVVAELDAQSGTLTSGKLQPHHRRNVPRLGHGGAYGDDAGSEFAVAAEYGGDTGGASRFFPTFRYQAKANDWERPRVNGVAHPTVKPLDLMRWLVRLVTPPGGQVLDMFAGSGTTAEAALMEDFHCIAVERDPTYLPLIAARVERAKRNMQPGMARLSRTKPIPQLDGQTDFLAEFDDHVT